MRAFARLNISRQQLAEKGFAIFFRQLLDHNFFHADMHPGNVFVETANPANPRYIALDIAIVGQLSRDDSSP
jgi:ubiquinone biosynthesis protein